jgi:hypothetical protein
MRPLIEPRPREVTRQGDPLGGGKRRQVQSEAIVVNAATGVYAKTSFQFDVMIPSARLACLVAVTFKPANSDDTAFPTSGVTAWYLTGDAWIALSNDQGGSLTRANQFLAKTPLPTSYEVPTTLVRRWRGTVTVPNSPGAGIVPGTLYVTVIWEPAPGESTISDQELQALFAAASITGVQGGSVSVTGA